MKYIRYALIIILCCPVAARGQGVSSAGSVRGTVLDAATGAPVAGSGVYLLTTKICKISGAKFSVRTASGDYLLPHYSRAEHAATSDAKGSFSLEGIPAQPPFKSYTVLVRAPGYGCLVIHDARVYPERILKIDARLHKGDPLTAWFEGTDTGAPVAYIPAGR